MILKFREMVGQGLGVTGIQDIWTAVMEGKGWTLIVEKDFKVPGFTTAGNEHFVTPVSYTHLDVYKRQL